MIRLYFNRAGKFPWSVDSGPGTPEINLESVLVSAFGYAVYRPLGSSQRASDVPVAAWIQFDNGRLVNRDSDGALIEEAK